MNRKIIGTVLLAVVLAVLGTQSSLMSAASFYSTSSTPGVEVVFIRYFTHQPTDDDLAEITQVFRVSITTVEKLASSLFLVKGTMEDFDVGNFLETQHEVEATLRGVDANGVGTAWESSDREFFEKALRIPLSTIENGAALDGRAPGAQLALVSEDGDPCPMRAGYKLTKTIEKWFLSIYSKITCQYVPLQGT